MQLRDFQDTVKQEVYTAWETFPNVLAVLPTGGGKTALFSSILQDFDGVKIALAHRQELVGQMSISLAKWGIKHRIVASDAVIRQIVKLHHAELGRSFYDPGAQTIAASVDTLIRRQYDWFGRVGLWVVDEAHHLLEDNKWGEVVALFPNAKGLGVTATPIRADGKGLGRDADGLIDVMVVGPTGRDLMNLGWLSDYGVYSFKPDDLDFGGVETGKTGDLKINQLRKATHASRQLVGDVVKTYLMKAKGKRGITFAVDIEQARELTQEYIDAGVPADIVTAKTPLPLRAFIIKQFRDGDILQLVNVDLFGEGFDVPAVEVVSMARRTESYSLFSQQLGRMLRPVYAPGTDMSTAAGRLLGIALGGKPRGILLDHVGNYISHAMKMGLPEDPKPWTLDAREKRGSTLKDGIALTGCENCGLPYERFRTQCPACGFAPTPAERTAPEQVDGDLELLDRTVLKAMIAEVARIDNPPQVPTGATPIVAGAIHKNHIARFEGQQELRAVIAEWGGWRKQEGLTDREAQRKFYLDFGVDIMTAQALNKKDAGKLRARVLGLPEPTKADVSAASDAGRRAECLGWLKKAADTGQTVLSLSDDSIQRKVRKFVSRCPGDSELREANAAAIAAVQNRKTQEIRGFCFEQMRRAAGEGQSLAAYLGQEEYDRVQGFSRRHPEDAEFQELWASVSRAAMRGLPAGVKLLSSGRYAAESLGGGNRTYLGTFDTPEEAEATIKTNLKRG
jgi:superfamily II DNA or RNA helicase